MEQRQRHAIEIIDSDPASHDIEIIDGATGLAQGYWTCTTYAPMDTFTLPPDVDGTKYIGSYGGSGSNFAITVFWGSNLTVQHQYKFTEWVSLWNLNDTDADGYSELVFWTWTGNLSLYNFTSHNLKWKRDGMKVQGLNTAWILGTCPPREGRSWTWPRSPARWPRPAGSPS